MAKSTINWQAAIDACLQAARKEKRPLQDNEFYASALNGCLRQSVLNRFSLGEMSASTLRNFGVGTMFHEFMSKSVSQGYVGRPVEFERRVELEVDGIKFRGHVDCFDGETVYDFKTSANVDYALRNDNVGYVWQLNVYMRALGVEKGVLVYIDKKDLRVVEKHVPVVDFRDITGFCHEVMAACAAYKESGVVPGRCGCIGCRFEPQ